MFNSIITEHSGSGLRNRLRDNVGGFYGRKPPSKVEPLPWAVTKGYPMAKSVKQAFTHLAGLPSRDDPELTALMDTVGRLPRASVEEIARNLFRAALAHHRTDDPLYLTCLAEDALVTMRLRRDAECERALNKAPTKPANPDDAIDVEEMLARRGL